MRKHLFLTLAVSCFVAGCAGDQARDVAQYTIQDFLGTVGYRGASFSPDNNQILVSSNHTGIYNAYAIPVAADQNLVIVWRK